MLWARFLLKFKLMQELTIQLYIMSTIPITLIITP
jgi:hypothetical protein